MVTLARYIFHKVCCNKADRPSNRVLLILQITPILYPHLMVSIRPAGFDPSQSLRNPERPRVATMRRFQQTAMMHLDFYTPRARKLPRIVSTIKKYITEQLL